MILPLSRVSISASISASRASISPSRRIERARSWPGIVAHGPVVKAARAAPAAVSTAPGSSGTSAQTSPV